MTIAQARWGDQIAVEVVNGVPYRMYTERPRRVEDLLAFAGRWDTRPHIIQGDRIVTFDEMQKAVLAKVAELSGLGVKRGEHVFILGWNSPEWVVNFWACLCVGAVPVLANTWWSAAEVTKGLAVLEPVLTLADGPAAAKMPAGSRCGRWAVTPEHKPDTDTTSESKSDEEETAVIIFTSGTSGGDLICATAAKVYARGHKGSYDLVGSDF